jgi:hypothetical protein
MAEIVASGVFALEARAAAGLEHALGDLLRV